MPFLRQMNAVGLNVLRWHVVVGVEVDDLDLKRGQLRLHDRDVGGPLSRIDAQPRVVP